MDRILWQPVAHVDKYSPEQASWLVRKLGRRNLCGADFIRAKMIPEDGEAESIGNTLVNNGAIRIVNLMNAGGGVAFTATTTRLGVGNSTTAAQATDTDLLAAAGAANRQFRVMDATYPSASGTSTLTARATYNTGVAEFAWNEWGLDVGTATVADGTTVNTLMNRKAPAALGTKTAGSSWVFTVTITIA